MTWERKASFSGGRRHTGRPRAPSRPAAFSLPELMIALVILGLGLLIIAAALPVGLVYTRDSADFATGDAVADYAGDVFGQSVRTARLAFRQQPDGTLVRLDDIFRPRNADGTLRRFAPPQVPFPPSQDVSVEWEPLIKVRPLIGQNLDPLVNPPAYAGDGCEQLIGRWLDEIGVQIPPAGEFDPSNAMGTFAWQSLVNEPALSARARVYPPVSQPFRFSPINTSDSGAQFCVGNNSWLRRNTAGALESTAEAAKLLERRFMTIQFYRRVQYFQVGLNPGLHDGDEQPGDPLLYEVITVVCRRPSDGHWFAVQDDQGTRAFQWPNVLAGGAGNSPSPVRAFPTPWLVVFTKLPDIVGAVPAPQGEPWDWRRPIDGRYSGNLVFECSRAVGNLLPAGSIFVPARNDEAPSLLLEPNSTSGGNPATDLSAWMARRVAGFVPHSPTMLPVFEVIERIEPENLGSNEPTRLIVRNPGVFPWVSPNPRWSNDEERARQWPVWIIPPAARVEGANNVVFERRPSVVAFSRKFVRLTEIP